MLYPHPSTHTMVHNMSHITTEAHFEFHLYKKTPGVVPQYPHNTQILPPPPHPTDHPESVKRRDVHTNYRTELHFSRL